MILYGIFYLGGSLEDSLMSQGPETNKINSGNSTRVSPKASSNSFNGGSTDFTDQALADSRQERSLGVTIIFISALFVICQSVKMVPTIYEIFLCKQKQQKLHSGESHQTFCETTDVIDRFIR